MQYEAFVITIEGNEKSEKAAERCIKSGYMYDFKIHKFKAITPKDRPYDMFAAHNLPPKYFEETYSRKLNCMAAFLSHFSLWERCITSGLPTYIFEHDAVLTGMPPISYRGKLATFSKPSYGEFKSPSHIGAGPLTQKGYFGGAHGYIVNPQGAWAMVEQAQQTARPTDIFLNYQYFPWIQEIYPWVCEAHDDFSTIQNVNGCLAKHNFNKKYGIEDVLT